MGSLLSIDDLADDDLTSLLGRAAEFREGPQRAVASTGRLLGLIFLEPSLRTRIGFTAAATRLGWQAVDVFERRHSPTSQMESWDDTIRTVAGYADVILTRPGQPLCPEEVARIAPCPIINGGDVGPRAQHPSQALIDLFAMEQLVGPVGELAIAIVGDPRMRAVRSLLALLARRLPGSLSLVGDEDHIRQIDIPTGLQSRTCVTSWDQLDTVDVAYIAGIPHGALPLDRRGALLATEKRVASLAPRCILLSPMPVIDEMAPAVKRCARNRMFEQSDLGLYVRMALLEHIIGS